MRNVLRVFAALALLTMSVVGAQPALAKGGHCVYRLEPTRQQRHTGVIPAKLKLVGCYAHFRDAVAVGSYGSIQLASDAAPASLTDEDIAAGSASSRGSVLIGTEYNGSGFAGASNLYFMPTTCTASTTWQIANVGVAWNDLFESGKGFGGCHTNKKFRNTNFGGSVVTCTPNCSDYGALDNQVSSLRWRV